MFPMGTKPRVFIQHGMFYNIFMAIWVANRHILMVRESPWQVHLGSALWYLPVGFAKSTIRIGKFDRVMKSIDK